MTVLGVGAAPRPEKGSTGWLWFVPGRAYLRCNRSVDENFLPGIRGTLVAAAAAVGAALALRLSWSADAIALSAEAAVVDESSFVSAVSW